MMMKVRQWWWWWGANEGAVDVDGADGDGDDVVLVADKLLVTRHFPSPSSEKISRGAFHNLCNRPLSVSNYHHHHHCHHHHHYLHSVWVHADNDGDDHYDDNVLIITLGKSHCWLESTQHHSWPSSRPHVIKSQFDRERFSLLLIYRIPYGMAWYGCTKIVKIRLNQWSWSN